MTNSIKPKAVEPMAGMSTLVQKLIEKKSGKPAQAPTQKSAALVKIEKSLNVPDLWTYLHAYTDLSSDTITELFKLVESNPSPLAVQQYAKKFDIILDA